MVVGGVGAVGVVGAVGGVVAGGHGQYVGDGDVDGCVGGHGGEQRAAEYVKRSEEEFVSAWRVEEIEDGGRGAV